MAADRTLGYDLLTYICQVATLFTPDQRLTEVIGEHDRQIRRYFEACSIDNHLPYLLAFAREKANYEMEKGNTRLYERYENLYTQLTNK